MTISTDGGAPDLPSHIPSLDGLRAVSISLVIIGHAVATNGFPVDAGALHHLGNIGVRCFFVISGFLITTLLMRELEKTSTISLRRFFLRRTLRIFPACFFFIFVIWLAYSIGWIELRDHDLLHALTYTMNFYDDRGWYLNHLWSLSVEEQFYLVWPLLLWGLGLRAGMRIAIVVVIVVPFVRAYMALTGFTDTAMTRNFQAVCDTLAIGCLMATYYNVLRQSPIVRRLFDFWLFPLFPVIGLGLSVVFGINAYYVWGQSIANLSIAATIFWVIYRPDSWIGRMLNSTVFVGIGTLSYSLYLWQEPFLNPEVNHWSTTFPINLLLTVLGAMFSYVFIEKTFLRLKHV